MKKPSNATPQTPQNPLRRARLYALSQRATREPLQAKDLHDVPPEDLVALRRVILEARQQVRMALRERYPELPTSLKRTDGTAFHPRPRGPDRAALKTLRALRSMLWENQCLVHLELQSLAEKRREARRAAQRHKHAEAVAHKARRLKLTSESLNAQLRAAQRAVLRAEMNLKRAQDDLAQLQRPGAVSADTIRIRHPERVVLRRAARLARVHRLKGASARYRLTMKYAEYERSLRHPDRELLVELEKLAEELRPQVKWARAPRLPSAKDHAIE